MVMAGSPSEDYVPVGGSLSANGFSSMQHCQSVDSLAEWRYSDQVENGTPSTSPPYWDSEEDDDAGPKPSDLYGKFTWKIENFSQISKRELRSNLFEVGGYSWYILIYPQGCDACNHLSLFLCVANHDKLLPGWGHYALFTIAVVNKDLKKNKYNDTLHKFWKKEHDWGWKKFLEQTKLMDGFVDDDTLTIKAQVQVIRERAHRPFRCLDCQYRRELIRVYLSNVEQTCGRFVDEERQKLQTLVGDKAMWSSFHAFWLGIDQDTRCYLSRDKTDAILKKVVKHFFIEKEVSSTLVMDSLYSGLRALESKNDIDKLCLEKDEESAPFILSENDMFILADDVFLLLERAALELPRLSLPSKGEKGLPNRAKDGCSGDDFNRDSILRDERRLTELGRKTLEIYILADIFSNRIKRAYHEAVALKMQEELIREEEAAEQAENEKREKRAKKKQAKQRRINRKSKDGGNDEKSVGTMTEQSQLKECPPDEQILKGDASDASDRGNYGDEAHHTTEACSSEIPNGHDEKKSLPFVDDSSSTCSSDSVPSVVNGPYKEFTSPTSKKKQNSSRRGKRHQNKETRNGPTSNAAWLLNAGPEPKGLVYAFKDQVKKLEQTFFKKTFKEETGTITSDKIILKDQIDEEIPCISVTTESSSFSTSQSKKTVIKTHKIKQISSPELPSKIVIKTKSSEEVLTTEPTSKNLIKTEKSAISKSEAPKHQAFSISRPSSTPIIPNPKPTVPFVSTSQAAPQLSRSLSSVNCLNSDPIRFSPISEPQSYRNAILGINTTTNARTTAPNLQPSSSPSNPGIFFGSVRPESLHNIRIGDGCGPVDSSSQSQGVMPDEFPHLDIINDLLDEDGLVGMATFNGYQLDYFHPFNWQQNFPADVDPLYGPCQLDLPEYYCDDEISQMVYDSFMPINGFSEPQNQWPVNGTDLSMMSFGSTIDVNGYTYQVPEYSGCGVGGYNVLYQPANGI